MYQCMCIPFFGFFTAQTASTMSVNEDYERRLCKVLEEELLSQDLRNDVLPISRISKIVYTGMYGWVMYV